MRFVNAIIGTTWGGESSVVNHNGRGLKSQNAIVSPTPSDLSTIAARFEISQRECRSEMYFVLLFPLLRLKTKARADVGISGWSG